VGYSVWQRSSSVFIDGKDADAALAAIRALHGRETAGCEGAKHFSFVRPDFRQATSLADVLAEWRWDVRELAPDGSVVNLDFLGQSLGDEDLLFATLAPFVRSGSYVEMVGETGIVWRWVCRNGAVYVVPAVVTFPAVDETHRIDPQGPFEWLRFRGEP
jgi:hypothetical protein